MFPKGWTPRQGFDHALWGWHGRLLCLRKSHSPILGFEHTDSKHKGRHAFPSAKASAQSGDLNKQGTEPDTGIGTSAAENSRVRSLLPAGHFPDAGISTKAARRVFRLGPIGNQRSRKGLARHRDLNWQYVARLKQVAYGKRDRPIQGFEQDFCKQAHDWSHLQKR